MPVCQQLPRVNLTASGVSYAAVWLQLVGISMVEFIKSTYTPACLQHQGRNGAVCWCNVMLNEDAGPSGYYACAACSGHRFVTLQRTVQMLYAHAKCIYCTQSHCRGHLQTLFASHEWSLRRQMLLCASQQSKQMHTGARKSLTRVTSSNNRNPSYRVSMWWHSMAFRHHHKCASLDT